MNAMSIGVMVINYKQTNEWSDKIRQINITMDLTPEESFRQEMLSFLDDIKEKSLSTLKGHPVIIKETNVVGFGIIGFGREKELALKLEEEGAIKIIDGIEQPKYIEGWQVFLIKLLEDFDKVYGQYRNKAEDKLTSGSADAITSLTIICADLESLYQEIETEKEERQFFMKVARYGRHLLDHKEIHPIVQPLYGDAKKDERNYLLIFNSFIKEWNILAKDIVNKAKKYGIEVELIDSITKINRLLNTKLSIADNPVDSYYIPYWNVAKKLIEKGHKKDLKDHLIEQAEGYAYRIDMSKNEADSEWAKFENMREISVWWSHYQIMRLTHGVFDLEANDPYYGKNRIIDQIYRYEFEQIARGENGVPVFLKRRRFEDWIKRLHNYLIPRLKIAEPRPVASEIPRDEAREWKPTPKNQKITQPFPTPADAKWEEITIKFLDGHNVSITLRDITIQPNYKEMGFQDNRKRVPNKQWQLLQLLATKNGELSWEDNEATDKVKKKKQLLSDTLREYFQIKGDPFHPYKTLHVYKIKISLIPESGNKVRNNLTTDTEIQDYLKEETEIY